MKVLIIEDDQRVAEGISLIFELRWPGSEVVSTAQGSQAAELVEKD